MPQQPAQVPAGWNGQTTEHVRAQVALTEQLLARSRQHATTAMAQVERDDRLLHRSGQPSDGAERAGGRRSGHLTEMMEHELAVHLRAVEVHEQAAQLQEAWGWPERAAAARSHAAHARELSQQARAEMARSQALVIAAQERVEEPRQHLP